MLLIDFGKLTEFPFNADVWGTFSDWFMILVTATTAILLWLTFRSQKKSIEIQNETLREQQKINRIEQYNHKERIKPKFILSGLSAKEYSGIKEGKYKNGCFIKLQIQSNEALNVQYDIFNTNNNNVLFENWKPGKIQRMQAGIESSSKNILFIASFNKAEDSINMFFNFILNFQDTDENCYEQNILFNLDYRQNNMFVFHSEVKEKQCP